MAQALAFVKMVILNKIVYVLNVTHNAYNALTRHIIVLNAHMDGLY
jgi:hypothetical protein